MPPCLPSTSLCRLHFRKPKAYLNLQSKTVCRLGRTVSPNALISSFLDLMNSFLFLTMTGISATAAASLPTSPMLQDANLSNECRMSIAYSSHLVWVLPPCCGSFLCWSISPSSSSPSTLSPSPLTGNKLQFTSHCFPFLYRFLFFKNSSLQKS